jgi:hypothetical protein
VRINWFTNHTLQVNNAGIMGVTMEIGDDEAAVKEMARK